MISKFHISKHGQCGVSVTGLELDDQYLPEDSKILSKYNYEYGETVTINILLKLDYNGKVVKKHSKHKIVEHDSCMDVCVFNMPVDGVYKIIHCIVPTDKWIKRTSADPSCLPEFVVYYDGENFIFEKNVVSLEELIQLTEVEDTTLITSSKLTFNMCNILNCFNRSNQYIFDGLVGGCRTNDIKSEELNRDIVFMGLNVIRYNLDLGNYLTAQRTLDRLTTCGSLCDQKILKYNDCGCH
jgi:hypothetical protein